MHPFARSIVVSLLLLGCIATLAAEPKIAAADDAAYALPGSFAPDTTLAQLRERFGAANVKVGEIDGAEGSVSRGIVLFADDPLRRAEIFVEDEDKTVGVSAIRVSGTTSKWHFDNGVTLGMTLAKLAALNGKPVQFSGLDWDYGGQVGDWHGGTLDNAEGSRVFRAVSLTHSDAVADGTIPMGDATFESDDPAYPKQGALLFVGQLMLSFIPAEVPSDEQGDGQEEEHAQEQ